MRTLREVNPLVLSITNDVVVNFTANGLLALGASPIMPNEPRELKEFIPHCSAVLINIGSLEESRKVVIREAVKCANEFGVPIVLDPVASGATSYRRSFCLELLNNYTIDVIRGNASEVNSLINVGTMRGTDSDTSLDSVSIAKKAGFVLNTAILITGKVDVIYANKKLFKLSNGTPMLTKITGGGCLLGAIVAAFLYNKEEPTWSQLINAVSTYNIAAEFAERGDRGTLPGSFQINLLNELSTITESEVAENIKVEEVN